MIKVRDLKIGEGIPKIVVPVTGNTKNEILEQIGCIKNNRVDIIEWRVDYFIYAFEIEKIKEVLLESRSLLGNIPLLFTFRTAKEGGEKDIDLLQYESINKSVIETGLIDIIDLQLFIDNNIVKNIIEVAHNNNTKVILSNHDFIKTPSKEDMIKRLKKMDSLGGDLLKIAVMPKNKKDVLKLLEVAVYMEQNNIKKPIITISMSKTGLVSRITGELFNSSLTFGSVYNSSAPGQIGVDDLDSILKIIHRNI